MNAIFKSLPPVDERIWCQRNLMLQMWGLKSVHKQHSNIAIKFGFNYLQQQTLADVRHLFLVAFFALSYGLCCIHAIVRQMNGKNQKDFHVKDLRAFTSSDNSGMLHDKWLVIWGFKILSIAKIRLYPLNLGLITLSDRLWLTWGVLVFKHLLGTSSVPRRIYRNFQKNPSFPPIWTLIWHERGISTESDILEL